MLTNYTTTNIVRLPDGTERETIVSITHEVPSWTTVDYLWLAVVVLFAVLIFYPILKWLYQRRRANKNAKSHK